MELTSIQQSHILQTLKTNFGKGIDLHSADMSYVWTLEDTLCLDVHCPYMLNSHKCEPCWSLSALLKILPVKITGRYNYTDIEGVIDQFYFRLVKDVKDTDIIGEKVDPYEAYKIQYVAGSLIGYTTGYHISCVDACVEMIEKIYKNLGEDGIVNIS